MLIVSSESRMRGLCIGKTAVPISEISEAGAVVKAPRSDLFSSPSGRAGRLGLPRRTSHSRGRTAYLESLVNFSEHDRCSGAGDIQLIAELLGLGHDGRRMGFFAVARLGAQTGKIRKYGDPSRRALRLGASKSSGGFLQEWCITGESVSRHVAPECRDGVDGLSAAHCVAGK
jgi:hypothetical protein